MINFYTIKRAVEQSDEFILSEDEKLVLDKNTNKIIATVEEIAESMRKKMHCNFKVIYDEHATLSVVYRCKECGTVIFASDAYDDYDENLACPTCGGYETHYDYWTQEDIDSDIKKQNTLEFFDKIMEHKRLEYEREKKTGLCFYELWKKDIRFKSKIHYTITLKCNDALEKGFKKLNGLHFEIIKWKKEESDFLSKCVKRYIIPLSWSKFYIKYIYPIKRKKRELI